ncbi:MAG: hypothetical protein IJJ43_05040 [Oscillospiraceae bacterium]|nr:hypothetical protein [Oscillospiraceae bacterium]
MKKRWITAVAMLLALLMLCSCGWSAPEPDVEAVPFEEMVYTRPDLSEMDALMAELNELLDGGASYRTVEAKLDECFDWYYTFSTMYALAEVYSYLDMTDNARAEEYEWISTASAAVQQAYDKLYYACAGSALADKLERRYFWEGFVEEYSDPEDSAYSDEYVALLEKESELLARYHELVAAPVINFRGEETEVYELLPGLDGWDYNDAVRVYYETYNAPLAEIFIELVRVRQAMAEQLGYDSYEQMQYEFYFERDYSPEDARGYLEQIKQDAVPFYQLLSSLDAYRQVWYDEVDEPTLYSLLSNASGEIGGEVERAFTFMSLFNLYDISVSSKKAQMSFETYFPDYEEPFLFLGASGDTEDILSFAHEFGHFCDAYVNNGAMSETIDLAEVYSQAMELLVLSRLGDSMSGEDVANIARIKAIGLADMYVQQAAFAEFEMRVYALDAEELSADKLNEIMLELSRTYGFCEKGFEWAYAMGWIDITHFFEAPFYVISYPVSSDLAMQICAMELEEEGSGMDKYLEVLPHDYTKIMELVEEGGFASPFGEGRVADAMRVMRQLYGMV